MDANLSQWALSLRAAMINPLPSDGSIMPLQLKTSIGWNKKRLVSNSSHMLSLSWESAGLAFLLNMILLESPTLSVSTDPILSMTCDLVEYQGSLPNYGMPSLFRCSNLIIAYKVALMASPIRIQLFNQDDSNDSIVFFED